MKSLKDFKCGWIIPKVDKKKGKNSQFFGEITIKASPPIYATTIELGTQEFQVVGFLDLVYLTLQCSIEQCTVYTTHCTLFSMQWALCLLHYSSSISSYRVARLIYSSLPSSSAVVWLEREIETGNSVEFIDHYNPWIVRCDVCKSAKNNTHKHNKV